MPIHLNAARLNAKFTQREAAKKLDISRNTLSNYENHKTVPDIEMAKKIAELYRLSVNDIIWRYEE